jgi:hypothetical protein
MNKTFMILYLIMITAVTALSFVFMKVSVTSILFAVIFLVNIFLFIDVFKKGG